MSTETLPKLTAATGLAWRRSAWVVAMMVTLQALYLGWFVTPPGDIPDESGHFAYVRDIGHGTFFPLMGEATIPNDLWFNAPADDPVLSRVRPNYITQHPPLYYLVAALPYQVSTQLTDDRWYQIRAARSISALSLGLLVFTLFVTMAELGVHPLRAMLLSTAVGMVPMINHLASGITNDIFLFMLCAIATRFLVRFVVHQDMGAAYACAALLSLAGATKMTAWPLILGFLFIMVVEMRQPLARWFLNAIGLSAISLALPMWWAARNLYHFGNPMAIHLVTNQPLYLNYTIADYLRAQPFFDWMVTHSYGLIGFAGYCQTPDTLDQCMGVKSTRVAHQGFEFVLWSLAAMATLLLVYTAWHHFRQYRNLTRRHSPGSIQMLIASTLKPGLIRSALLIATAVAGSVLFYWSLVNVHREGELAWLINPVFLSALLIALLGSGIAVFDENPRRRLVYYGLALFLCYGLLIIYQSHKAYILVAELRGVQGRYFYPFLPLLVVSMGWVLERLRLPVVLLLWMALGIAWAHLHTYVVQLIPFFEQVRI